MSNISTVSEPAIAYEQYDRDIHKTIAFRLVSLEVDLARIHRWMNEPHVVPFWQLNFSRDRMRSHLEKALADRHQTLYIGLLDGFPMSYWETYWVKDDVVGRTYNFDPSDRGIHLLIGETDYLGKGYALPLLRAMTAFQFQHSETTKVIAEPDSRNHKMIHIFKRCGYEFQKTIDLPDKTGALMFCDRANFERLWL